MPEWFWNLGDLVVYGGLPCMLGFAMLIDRVIDGRRA